MSHFAHAFWSSDYAGGLGVLFGKLQQGVQENAQVLTIARLRADAEERYGNSMSEIGPSCDRISEGFSRDDGASVRKAYDGMRTEMEEASKKHVKIASNIRELVVYPFGRWCDQHASRVQHSQDDLQSRVKAHDRQAESVRKLRSHYFNKCRLVEDLEEEDKLAFKEPQSTHSSSGPSSPPMPTPSVKVQEPEDEIEEAVEIGDDIYEPEQLKKILAHMLNTIKTSETKVPILGTYQNTSLGSDIVEYIQSHMNGTSVSYAEKVGQDLIGHGFLRLVGSVGSVFTNSSRMHYQWRPKTFKWTGFPENKKPLGRSSTVMSIDSLDSPLVGSVAEYVSGWNPLNNPYPNENPAQKLRREAFDADERYKSSIKKLDLLRCTLEEAMIDHLKFMEQCELDRLKAIKSVVLDLSGAISNVIPSLQSTVDNMMLFQETVQPLSDLRYMLENYRTGPFIPRVQPYENYYNSVDEQTFGVDLEARARSDRKRVPLIITTILTFLDNHYPLLDGDEARRAIWLVDVPLAATHRLRNEVNNGKIIPQELLEKYEVPIVASLLKLYLLELPDSLVSSSLYEIIKTIYTTPATADTTSDSATTTRINVLQNTLGQLRLANIATLDALATHFARLVDLTSADDAYITKLTTSLAPCTLRSRTESAMHFEEKYNVRFVRDLLAHKEAIFGELKRAASLQHSASVARAASTAAGHPPTKPATSDESARIRGLSTDESHRRQHQAERNRAIAANRSRANSPAGSRDLTHATTPSSAARHRRDSSRGPVETRFPVNPAPSATSTRTTARKSLEVPGSDSPTTKNTHSAVQIASAAIDSHVNGHTSRGSESDKALPDTPGGVVEDRTKARPFPAARKASNMSGGAAVGRKRDSAEASVAGRSSLEKVSNLEGEIAMRPQGVELVDRPMQD